MTDNNYFVPNATYGGRQDTATALTGAADEFGISQRAVRASQGGFWVSDELADRLFSDVDETALSESDTASDGDDGTATVNPDENADADADADKSEQSDDKTPEDDPSSEEQTDKAPAKKSRSKK